MNRKRYFLLIGVLLLGLLLVAGWCWRFSSLNRFYWDISKQKIAVYGTHEMVWFEDDYLEKDLQADGYGIRVDNFSIESYQEYMNANNYPIPEGEKPPQRIALVTVTLYNENSTANGVMLPELMLHGIDSYSNVDWDVLYAANPVLNNKPGINLKQGSECTLVLPFPLFEKLYNAQTWDNMDDYEFFLRITFYPTAKDIRLER